MRRLSARIRLLAKRGLGPALVLGLASALWWPVIGSAFTLGDRRLPIDQRTFRIWNNFTDPTANDNLIADPDFPGASGAVLAIWKGVAEWGSRPHGTGGTDPFQVVIGSGGANFDPFFAGLASDAGTPSDRVISQISGFGSVLAFTEIPPGSSGWRIRFREDPHIWHDGPGMPGLQAIERDLQGIATHEYGHALGLGHSQDPTATMFGSIPADGGLDFRSIEADDIAGLHTLYGMASPAKPRIHTYSLAAGVVTLHGENFDPAWNEVWWTPLATSPGTAPGLPIVQSGVTASVDGRRMTLTPPAGVGPGEVLVRIPGDAFDSLSNAFPFDPATQPFFRAPRAYGQGQTTSFGTQVSLIDQSLPSASLGGFTVRIDGGPSTGSGWVFSGPVQDAQPLSGGTLLVGAPLRRELPFPIFFGTASVVLAVDVSDVGSTRYLQAWVPDPGSPGGGALSNGLEVRFIP